MTDDPFSEIEALTEEVRLLRRDTELMERQLHHARETRTARKRIALAFGAGAALACGAFAVMPVLPVGLMAGSMVIHALSSWPWWTR